MAGYGLPFAPSREYSDFPDFATALRRGYETRQRGVEADYKPKQLAEQLLSSQLANKLKNIELQYAPQKAQLGIQGLRANLQAHALKMKQAQALEEIYSKHPELRIPGLPNEFKTIALLGAYPQLGNMPFTDQQQNGQVPSQIDTMSSFIPAIPGNQRNEEMLPPVSGASNQGYQPKTYRDLLIEGLKNKISGKKTSETKPTGGLSNIVALNDIKRRFGENSPEYQSAKSEVDLEKRYRESMIGYRDKLAASADKRAGTQIEKLINERREVEEGFLPGSNGTIRLNPEEQEAQKGIYDLEIQKKSTDVDTRKRSLFATNVDKTLDSIDVDALVQYGGLAGSIERKRQEGKALTGNESEAYRQFQKNLSLASLLGKQIRQFYGDSITPQIQEQISEMVKPASWINNPRVAKIKFNTLKDILNKETGTYKQALTGIKEYRTSPKSAVKRRSFKNAQEFRDYLSGLSPEERIEAKKLYLGQ